MESTTLVLKSKREKIVDKHIINKLASGKICHLAIDLGEGNYQLELVDHFYTKCDYDTLKEIVFSIEMFKVVSEENYFGCLIVEDQLNDKDEEFISIQANESLDILRDGFKKVLLEKYNFDMQI